MLKWFSSKSRNRKLSLYRSKTLKVNKSQYVKEFILNSTIGFHPSYCWSLILKLIPNIHSQLTAISSMLNILLRAWWQLYCSEICCKFLFRNFYITIMGKFLFGRYCLPQACEISVLCHLEVFQASTHWKCIYL